MKLGSHSAAHQRKPLVFAAAAAFVMACSVYEDPLPASEQLETGGNMGGLAGHGGDGLPGQVGSSGGHGGASGSSEQGGDGGSGDRGGSSGQGGHIGEGGSASAVNDAGFDAADARGGGDGGAPRDAGFDAADAKADADASGGRGGGDASSRDSGNAGSGGHGGTPAPDAAGGQSGSSGGGQGGAAGVGGSPIGHDASNDVGDEHSTDLDAAPVDANGPPPVDASGPAIDATDEGFQYDRVTVDDSVQGFGPNQFIYVGGWSHCGPAFTACTDGSIMYGLSNSWSQTANDYALFSFRGAQVKLYGIVDLSDGIAAVSIDGGPETDVDFYASVRIGNQLMWTSPVLVPGDHVMKIVVTGRKNPASSKIYINPDRVDVL